MATITESAGSSIVDASVIPYIRANETEMVAHNLRPGRPGYFYIDTLNVNQFVQKCSQLNLAAANLSSVHNQGDGIYCNATRAYASVVATSPNNTIYINENFVTINLMPVGANIIWTSSNTSDYQKGDIVYQVVYPTGFGTYNTVDSAGNPTQSVGTYSLYGGADSQRSFIGKVEYWNPVDKALVLIPLQGTLLCNSLSSQTVNANTVLYKLSDNRIAYGISTVEGNKFPASTIVYNVTQGILNYTNTTNPHIHYSGQTLRPNTADSYGNTLILSANAASDAVGNYVSITAGTGLGQVAQVLSVSTDKKTIFLDSLINPAVDGVSRYSIGFPTVDKNGILATILHIPEVQEFGLLTGTRSVTITDTPTVNDPAGRMRAMSYYKASTSSIYDVPNYRGTPVLKVAPVLDPERASVLPVDPGSRGSTTSPTTLDSSATGPVTYISDKDPVAQTFFTPKSKTLKQNYGIFASSVDLWFKNKPTGNSPQFPVVVRLVETKNGYPTSSILASSVVNCQNIRIADGVPDSANIGNDFTKNLNATRFSFEDPIYLLPDTEYAIVVHSESPDYQFFISDIGSYDISYTGATSSISVGTTTVSNLLYTYLTVDEAFAVSDALLFNATVKAAIAAGNTALRDSLIQSILSTYRSNNPTTALAAADPNISYYAVDPISGNAFQMTNLNATNAQSRISSPPNVGSFFMAQNSSTWAPLKNQMMMFVVNKAQFTTDPVIMNFRVDPKSTIRPIDDILLNADYIAFPTSKLQFSMYSTYLDSTDPSSYSFTLSDIPEPIIPKQKFKFGHDLKISSLSDSKEKYILPGNASSFQVDITMQTTDQDISPIFNSERLSLITSKNIINYASLSYGSFAVMDSTDLSGTDPSTITVVIDPPYISTGVQASANVTTAQIYGGRLVGLNVTNPGSGYIKTPNVTVKIGSTVVANVIVAGEDKKYGGNSIARYQTKKIVLADGFDAGDLRVWVDGIIPEGTAVYAYYKVQSAQDPDDFINKSWQLMEAIKDYKSPDQNTPIELTFVPYLINDQPSGYVSYVENDITYPLGGKFKFFAIKLILAANDPAVPPVLLNMRTIALPAG